MSPSLGHPAGAELDPGADGVAVGRTALEAHPQPVVTRRLVVAQQERRSGDLGQDDVEVAVDVDVGIGRAAADDLTRQISQCLGADRHEALVARVPEQPRPR